jgi:taurine transport system substrate-binding protein
VIWSLPMPPSPLTRRAALAAGAALLAAPALAQTREVTIAHQYMVVPFRVAMAAQEVERETGYRINWRMFQAGADVIRAMASGDVKIGEVGSSPTTAAIAQGLDVELFWILTDIADAEALIVRNGTGINAPQDLRGKRVGVPFVSTTHFHLLFALEQFGIPANSLRILNMRPAEIAAAWERGDIDATFVWEPTRTAVLRSGRVLITSGQLAAWGRPTFDGVIVERPWARANEAFMQAYTRAMARANAAYAANPALFGPGTPHAATVARITGARAEDVPDMMRLYRFIPAAQQASPAWLGGGAEGGCVRAIRHTAEFLAAQGRIQSVPANIAAHVTPRFASFAANA